MRVIIVLGKIRWSGVMFRGHDPGALSRGDYPV